NPRGVARHDAARGHILGDDAASPDDGSLANLDATQNRGARANRRSFPHDRRHDVPVVPGLQFPPLVHRSRISIVDERHAMSDKHLILDLDPFADEGVAGNFHPAPHRGAALNLDKRAYFRLVPDLAAVEVDELENLDVAAKLDVIRDRLELHSLMHPSRIYRLTALGACRIAPRG